MHIFPQTILGDFQKEQERFLQEKKAKQSGMIICLVLAPSK